MHGAARGQNGIDICAAAFAWLRVSRSHHVIKCEDEVNLGLRVVERGFDRRVMDKELGTSLLLEALEEVSQSFLHHGLLQLQAHTVVFHQICGTQFTAAHF
jgi:hypothetical protein